MAITLEQAQQQLDAWLAASLAVSKKQSYKIGTRELTYANAQHITKMIDYWQAEVARLSSNRPRGIRLRGITPL